ncbi:MAG: PAS domain S-box protein [Mucilaginibacter sp.]|uniref:PAS domain S-box protein n=1 Tax=Mucilaginibacter sp. TaxID=1882438 RepID=UPI0031AAF708
MTKSSQINSIDEQSIAASEERLRALVTATADVIYSLSADWQVMRQLDGRGFLRDTDKPVTDWQSRNIYPEDMDMVNEAIKEAIRNKKIFQLEHRVWRADGTVGWTFSRAVPILNREGEIIEWFGAASDITERKLAEQALQEIRDRSEQQRRIYETITATTPDLMYVFDLNYRFTYANNALLAMWGKSWDNAIGKSLLENGYEPWHAEMHEREIDRIKVTKQPIRGEVSFPHATLGRRVYDYILTPVLNENGEVEAIAGTTRDVTERKVAEDQLASSAEELQTINEEMAASNEELFATNEELAEAQGELQTMIKELGKTNFRLSESEMNFRRMVEQAPVAILVFRGPELVIDLANQGILEILGKDSNIVGRPLLEAMPELRGEPAVELLFDIYHKGISSDGTEVAVRMQRDGQTETRYFNFSYRPLRDGEHIIGVMDVAVEVTGQVLARQAIEWAEEQLRLAIDSAELATWYMDPATGDFFPSVRLKELFGYGPEEDMPLSAGYDRITEPHRELVRQAVENTLKTGAVYDIEYSLEGFRDKKLRWVRARGRLYQSDEHEAGSFFGVIADITESKLQEQRKDDFLSIASHELKTPLTSLKSTLQLLDRMKRDFTSPVHIKLLEQANRSMEKIGNLIDDLLQINRLDVGQLALHKTRFLIADMLNACCNHVRAAGNHDLIFEGDDQLYVYADENRIDQVAVNLVNNAVKYAPGSKKIYLSVERIPGFAKISVRDTGPGISEEKIPFLFHRYYRAETESKVYSGLGLGLYICAEIVKRHEGEIGVDTRRGIGSTFWFTLPLDE